MRPLSQSAQVAGDTVHGLFERRVRADAGAVALVCDGREYTYAELNRMANRLAHEFLAHGLAPEAVVAIQVARGVLAVASQLAVMKAGGTYLAIDCNMPASRVEHMLRTADAVLALVDQPGSEQLADAVPAWNVQALLAQQGPDHDPGLAIDGDRLAHIIFTSGSTGLPKGVARTHRAVACHVAWVGTLLPYVDEHTVLHLTSFSFVRGVWELYVPLSAGLRVVVGDVGQGVAELLAQLSHFGATRMATSPSLMRTIVRTQGSHEALQRLRCWYVSGEALPAALVDQVHAIAPAVVVCNVYGATEIGPVTALPMRAGQVPPVIPIGVADPSARLYVLDRDGRRAAANEVGEIVVSGETVPRGYLKRAEHAAAVLVPNPWATEPGQRLYRTGDLGRMRTNGSIELVGRADHQVKIRGYRVEIEEVEQALRRHPEVVAAAVTTRPDALNNLALTACVVWRGAAPGWAALRAFLAQSLPYYMVPGDWAALDALPLTINGKVDRMALAGATAAAQTRMATASEAATDDTGRVVRAAWEEVLGAKTDPDDEFLNRGGNSLLAAQLTARLAQKLGIQLPLLSLFLFPTLSGFTEHVRNMQWLLAETAATDTRWETLA